MIIRGRIRAALLFAILLLWKPYLPAQVSSANISTNDVYLIDLPTTLRLVGANNLDIKIAREKLAEAKANQESATWQFFPWISAGAGYRRHDDLIQNVEGRILDVHKDSYTVGPALTAQLDLGDAIFKNLAARQLAKAATHALEGQTQEAILAAAQGYFELAAADASVTVAKEAVQIAKDYAAQIDQAVEIGVAFKGDALRIRTQLERNQFALRQAEEDQRIASTRLAQLLRLDPLIALSPNRSELVPLSLVDTNATLATLVAQATSARPEIQQSRATVEAARHSKRGAIYGPLVPGINAQAFVGGLAGGNDDLRRGLGPSEDYQVLLGWRIGPGGLFDRSRIRIADARLRTAELSGEKLHDEIVRQIVDAFTRVHATADKLEIATRGVTAAEENLRLTLQRKEFAIGAVLETIQAEQDLTRLRQDHFTAITRHNKAQYELQRAIGGLASPSAQDAREDRPN